MKAAEADVEFKDRFESGEIAPSEFHHREHVRLAFVFLCEVGVEAANIRMRAVLKKILKKTASRRTNTMKR